MTVTVAWPRKTRELQTRIADSTIWNEFQFRDDDIIIASYPKAGTTFFYTDGVGELFRVDSRRCITGAAGRVVGDQLASGRTC